MSSARVGREWSVAQRVATHGPVLHRRKLFFGAFDRQSATPRQSSRCFCSTCPTSHVSITRTAIAQHCASARLTLVKHGLALVLSVHFHGLEPRDAVLELGARFIIARTRIARDRLAKPVQNVTKGSGQWRICGARRRENTFIIGGGGGIGCSRDGISTGI